MGASTSILAGWSCRRYARQSLSCCFWPSACRLALVLRCMLAKIVVAIRRHRNNSLILVAVITITIPACPSRVPNRHQITKFVIHAGAVFAISWRLRNKRVACGSTAGHSRRCRSRPCYAATRSTCQEFLAAWPREAHLRSRLLSF